MMIERWTENQILTRAAPTLVTEGLEYKGREVGLRLVVTAPSGNTIDAVGSVIGWLYDPLLAVWIRNKDLDIAASTIAATQRRFVVADFPVYVPEGRVLFAASGLTLTGGGTTVDVALRVFRR